MKDGVSSSGEAISLSGANGNRRGSREFTGFAAAPDQENGGSQQNGSHATQEERLRRLVGLLRG